MRKRIVSFLLLVAMVVTALPLVAFPITATETGASVWEEEDYNALFVTDGALMLSDFFTLNEYWGGSIDFPTAPCDQEAFATVESRLKDGTKWMVVRQKGTDTSTWGFMKTDSAFVTVHGKKAEIANYDAEADALLAAYRAAGHTDATALPEGDAKTFVGEDGYTYYAIKKYHTNLSGETCLTASDAYTTAYNKHMGETKAMLDAFIYDYGTVNYRYYFPNIGNQAYQDSTGVFARPYFTVENGFLRVSLLHSNTYFSLLEMPKDGVVYVDGLYAVSGTKKANAPFFSNRDLTIAATLDSNGLRFVRFNAYNNTAAGNPTFTSSAAIPEGDVFSLGYATNHYTVGYTVVRYTLNSKGAATGQAAMKEDGSFISSYSSSAGYPQVYATEAEALAAAYTASGLSGTQPADKVFQNGTYYYTAEAYNFWNHEASAWLNGEQFLDEELVTDTPTGYSDNRSFNSIYGLSGNGSYDRDFYAVRVYNRYLTDAERAQNHFAELAKWFRIDLSFLSLVDEDEMGDVYAAVADYTVQSEKGDVEEAILAVATVIAQEKFASLNNAWVALAVQYGLDLNPLLTMPKGMLVNTIAFLNDGYKTSANVKADYEAAFAADIAALTSDMTPAEYNALYAAQDYLGIAIDYLSASEHWGTEALAPNAEQYVWKWEHSKSAAHKITDSTGIVGNGFLQVPASFIVGETFNCNNTSFDGATTEMTFHDASIGTGTFLNIDDLRITTASKAVGDTVMITRLAIRNDDGTLRYAVGAGEYAFAANTTTGLYTFRHTDAATTAVVSMVRPAGTERYYNYTPYVSVEKLVLPTASQLGKTETGNADEDLKTVQSALAMLNSNGTLKTASQYTHSYFYKTHDLVDGKLVPVTDCTKESGATKAKYLFAFYKPIYHTDTDGKIYIIGGTLRTTNNGVGLGLGNDFLDGSADTDFYAAETGSLYVSLNGETVFDRDDLYFVSNGNLTGGTYFRYGYKSGGVDVERELYAYRTYKRVLTADELAQNHFVDIAKFFRLNLTGLDTLIAANNTEALNAVYASVADLNVATATRTEAQLAVTTALNVYVDEVYEDMKAEYPALAAFLEVARDYRLDVDTVLASARDMSSVYAVSFDGLSCAAAQALLDEAYLDAYYYLSYQEEGADEWNALLAGLAASPEMTGEGRLDLEALMALPLAERVGILDYKAELEAAATPADAQLVVDAYVAVAMEKYASADADYNAIYVKDGLRFAFDMMNAGSAWGGTMPTLPQQPSTLTDYWYDADGDGERDEGEIYDFTKEENRNGGFNYSATKDGKTYYPNADQSYTSEEEARAAAEKTLAGSYYKDYAFGEIVECINIAYRTAVNEFYAAEREFLTAYTWYTTQTDTRGNKIYIASYNPYNSSNLVKQMSDYVGLDVLTYTLGDGCLVMHGDYSTDGGLQMFNAGTAAAIATETSLQLVTKIGTTPIKKYEGVLFHNARPLFTYNATKTEAWFSGFGGTSGFKGTLEATEHFSTTKVQDLTFTLGGLLTANDTADCDTLTIATQDKVLGVGTGTYLNGTNELTVNATNYIGYSCSAVGNEIYAIRYYAKALSLAEIRQNHFADLAKYYKLDLTGYLGLSDSLRAEAHDLLSVYTVGDTSRDELAAALSTVVEKQYEGLVIAPENPELNAAFLAVAAFAALDLSPIENLDAADRTAIAELVVANFNPAYAINAAVVQSYYAELTEELSFLTFAGYQVRLTSGTVLADYAGVRAVFDIDADAIFGYLEEAAEEGYTYAVILEAHVVVDGEIADTLQFSCLIEDGEYSIVSETDSTAYVRTNAAGKEVLSFNYTVTYKGEEHRKDYLEADFGYAYSIHVVDTEDNAVSRNFSVNTKTFGDTVSAAELYTYFAGAGYAEDNVVKSVMDTLAE